MKNINIKFASRLAAFIFFLLVAGFISLESVNAGPLNDDAIKQIDDQKDITGISAGYNDADEGSVGVIVASVIKAFLSLLGIIFVILILTAGYKYMNADGDEGKVEEALDSIKRAIIGLIIIVAAYAITAFVFKNLPDSGSGGTGGTPQVTSPS